MGKYPCCQTISEVNLEPVSSIAAPPPPVMKGEASLAVACFHRWAVDPECGWWMNMEVPTPGQLFDQDSYNLWWWLYLYCILVSLQAQNAFITFRTKIKCTRFFFQISKWTIFPSGWNFACIKISSHPSYPSCSVYSWSYSSIRTAFIVIPPPNGNLSDQYLTKNIHSSLSPFSVALSSSRLRDGGDYPSQHRGTHTFDRLSVYHG